MVKLLLDELFPAVAGTVRCDAVDSFDAGRRVSKRRSRTAAEPPPPIQAMEERYVVFFFSLEEDEAALSAGVRC